MRALERTQRQLPWLLILLAAVLVVAGVGTGVVWQMRGETIDHPDAWDKRVAPYASVVAAKRKLSFEYPIYVDFLGRPRSSRSRSPPTTRS